MKKIKYFCAYFRRFVFNKNPFVEDILSFYIKLYHYKFSFLFFFLCFPFTVVPTSHYIHIVIIICKNNNNKNKEDFSSLLQKIK